MSRLDGVVASDFNLEERRGDERRGDERRGEERKREERKREERKAEQNKAEQSQGTRPRQACTPVAALLPAHD